MDPIPQNESEPSEEIKADARILWDYNTLYENPEKSDFIIVTSHDIRCVERGVELFKEGLAPIFIASGGHRYGEILGIDSEYGDLKEAEVIMKKAIELGVPNEAILVQDKSKNLGQVFEFLKKLFKDKELTINSGIFVYSPDQLRRARASLDKQWTSLDRTYVTSIKTTMEDYVNRDISLDVLIKHMVGHMKRIIEYPALGFQTEQEIPEDVMKAYERLVAAGYVE